MKPLLVALLLLSVFPAWAESKRTYAKTTSVSVHFRIVIPARARSAKIFDPSIPLVVGENRQIQQLPDGTVRITLVRP